MTETKDNEKILEEIKQEVEDNNVYLQQIEELKKKMDKMVDPDKYNQLEQERNKLLNDYINKRPAPKDDIKKGYTKEDVDKFGRELADAKELTNKEYIELSLKHRQAMLDVYNKDPYGLNGEKSADAQKAAEFYEVLLNDSSSDTQFRMKFEEYTTDDPMVIQKIRAAKAEQARLEKNKK